jgi:hypothetical protein
VNRSYRGIRLGWVNCHSVMSVAVVAEGQPSPPSNEFDAIQVLHWAATLNGLVTDPARRPKSYNGQSPPTI